MVSYVIRVRTAIDKNKARIYVSRFLKSNDFKSRYLKLSVQVYNENSITTILENLYLDTKNLKEVRTLKFNVNENILINFPSSELRESINKVVFSYKEINKKDTVKSNTINLIIIF